MNYKKQYNLLISTRIDLQNHRQISHKNGVYYEKHHILPKCLDGTNTKDNLILLTAREHYIAHLLLWKIHGSKLFYAIWFMSHPKASNGVGKGVKISSRRFEILREEQKRLNRKVGKDHWNYGKHHSNETKKKMSLAKKGKSSHMLGKHHTEETKEKLRQINLGKKHTIESREKMSESIKASNHPMQHYSQPFQHVKIRNNTTLRHKWKSAPEIYNIWINNNKPGHVTLAKLTNVTYLRPMIKWFKEYGNPLSNQLWIEWCNTTK